MPYYYYFVEISAAWLAALWVSRVWKKEPRALLIRLIKHKHSLWIALVIVIAPTSIIRPLLVKFLPEANPLADGMSIRELLLFGTFAFDGVIYALAAILCVAALGETDFHLPRRRIFAVSAMLVFAPYVIWELDSFLKVFLSVYQFFSQIFLPIMIIAVSRMLILYLEDQQTAAKDLLKRNRTVRRALIIGLLPTLLIIGSVSAGMNGAINRSLLAIDTQFWLDYALLFVCGISVFCCYKASFMLFSLKMKEANLCGILLLILNGYIAFFSNRSIWPWCQDWPWLF